VVGQPLDAPYARCARCGGELARVFTVPRLNIANYSSRAQARYGRLSEGEMNAGSGHFARSRLPSGSKPSCRSRSRSKPWRERSFRAYEGGATRRWLMF